MSFSITELTQKSRGDPSLSSVQKPARHARLLRVDEDWPDTPLLLAR
jgi:hypothetical protein